MLWILHIKGAFVLGKNDFRKSFSPKPACLAATENEIFQKFTSCWPKFTPLTRKWIYTLIFTSIHFRKEREREREREREKREPRSERERKKRLHRRSRRSSDDRTARRSRERKKRLHRRSRRSSDDRTACRSTSGAIIRRARSSIAPLVGRSHRSRLRSHLHRAISSSPSPRDLNLTGFDEFFCWVLFLLWMSVELIHYLHVYSWGSVLKIEHVKHFL